MNKMTSLHTSARLQGENLASQGYAMRQQTH